jgi:hypothetical protein
MNANAQSEAVAGYLRQNFATMQHFASTKQSGVSRLKNHLQAVTKALVHLTKMACNDPLNSIQAARHGMTGQGIIKICGEYACCQQLGMHLIFIACCAHGNSCEKSGLTGLHDNGIQKTCA